MHKIKRKQGIDILNSIYLSIHSVKGKFQLAKLLNAVRINKNKGLK